MSHLVNIIEKERLRRGISQVEVCKLVGVSRATWRRYLDGDGELGFEAFLFIVRSWGGDVGGVVFEGEGVRVEYSLKK